jgi:eukaryotic-like serine/threonine-protein kinase
MLNQTLSHYRVLEQIGAGGMGVVYRARDEQLERDVAIKVLRSRVLADDDARKRFRKEALSLARLNHPNIATVHEFGTQGDIDFLVVEYIPGITLDAKLTRGSLTSKEMIDFSVQLARGLTAAHEQGIVHRDLKPSNLRLTPDGRLKILDFGLAQLEPHASELGLTATLTKSQEMTGTLPYMAPEQLRGERADARSDIWSTGAVLYEMANGKRPFPQSNQAMLINAILNEPPEPPSKKITLPVLMGAEQIILKCLDKDPGRRYQSARELAVDLERLSTGTLPVGVPQSTPTNRYFLAGVVACLLAALIVGYFVINRKKHSAPATASPSHRRSVAVLGFQNLGGKVEDAWLSTALSEMLTTELAQGDQLRTIPGESVAQMKRSLSLPDADSFSQDTLSRIHENLGTDDVVIGSYVPLAAGVIRVDLRLQETKAGEILASVSEKGSASEIDELVSKAGTELRAKLGVSALSDAESASVRAALPSVPEAARLYSEGLKKLRLFDALEARTLLERAAALDPNHAPTHSALAEALSTLGYDEKAKQEAKRALDLASSFPREERLLIDGRYRSLTKDWSGAISSYRTLWGFFPDRVDYGLLLVRAQTSNDQPNEALATIAELRKLSLSKGESALIDLAESSVAAARSDYKLQQSSAERAAQAGVAIGANLLVAGALRMEGNAWQRLGQPEKSLLALEHAQELYTAAGDRNGAAICLMLAGDNIYNQGQFADARKQFERALAVFREIGDLHHTRGTLERIGNTFYDQGNLNVANDFYQQALKIDLETGQTSDLASDYGNIANALDGLGDLIGSRKMQDQALAAFEKTGDRRGAAVTLGNIGGLMIALGDPDNARKYFEQALTRMREISFLSGESYPAAGLGDASFMQGDVAGARKHYEEAFRLAREAHRDDRAAEIQTALAVVAREEKRFADGEALVRSAIVTFDKDNSVENAVWARAVLARIFLAQGKLAEAQIQAEKAITLSQQTPSQSPRFEAILADAQVKAKTGKISEAKKELDAMLVSTRKFGYRFYEYEARLLLAEIELQSDSAAARPHLAALEKDAQDHGLLLIANHAQAAAQGR